MLPLELNYAFLRSFLRASAWPKFADYEPTFFSIAGIDSKELPLSNCYAFFFRSQNPHGLGTLFTLALWDIIRRKLPDTELPEVNAEVRASREHPMKLAQRLDLLVHDGSADTSLQNASFALLIEVKVNHWLHNNLGNYWESIPNTACKVGVVLGTRPEQPEQPWVFISHRELGQAIEARLGPAIGRASPRYLPVLLHFLEHIKHMNDSDHSNFALAFNFAQRHREELQQVQQLLGQLTSEGMAATVLEAFGEGYNRRHVFDNRVDVCSLSFSQNNVYYVVYFGHMLNVEHPPSFTITLYCRLTDAATLTTYASYLAGLPLVGHAQLERLSWFDANHLVGKQYSFAGISLEDFRNEVRRALGQDWQPVEMVFAREVASASLS